jgi:D-alanyl-D-alanine carboxypeptidase
MTVAWRSWAVLSIAVCTAVVTVSGVPIAARAPLLSGETERAIAQIVQREMARGGVPGVQVGVWVGGRSYEHAFGVADVVSRRPLSTRDHVRIGSITKTFTATVVLEFVDDEKVALDDHLSRFVAGVPNGDQITIRQLLNMTAGVYDFANDPQFFANWIRDPLMSFSPDDVIAVVQRHGPSFTPGSSWGYSSSNYVLLGLVIEKVTGEPVGKAITQFVLKRLGLHETTFPTTSALPSPSANGYIADGAGGLRDLTRTNPAIAGAAGAMISTLDDLHRWAKALASGRLLRAATQRERLDAGDSGYGLGVTRGHGFVGHNGEILGYSSGAFSLVNGDATIVVLTNGSRFTESVALDISNAIGALLYPQRFAATRTDKGPRNLPMSRP